MTNYILKPCPFCGREAYIRIGPNDKPYIDAFHDKKCFRVDTFLISDMPLNRQIKIWNRRAKNDR